MSKPARLRPQARADWRAAVQYYRDEAGVKVAERLVRQGQAALDQIEQQPGIGSPRLGLEAGMPALRSWRVSGYPVLWFYFERDDHLDVVRLLGERQDIATLLTSP